MTTLLEELINAAVTLGEALATVAKAQVALTKAEFQLENTKASKLVDGIAGTNAETRAAYLRVSVMPALSEVNTRQIEVIQAKAERDRCLIAFKTASLLIKGAELRLPMSD